MSISRHLYGGASTLETVADLTGDGEIPMTGNNNRARRALDCTPMPVLVARLDGDRYVLTWQGTANLERAPTITGRFVSVPNATSPHVIQPEGGQSYFRLVAP